MFDEQLKYITQDEENAAIVFIAPDGTRYDKNSQGGILRAPFNRIADTSDIVNMRGIQGARCNIFIDLDSLPFVTGTETKIDPTRKWFVESAVNRFAEVKEYSIEDIEPDDQIVGKIYHLAEVKVM